MKKDPIKDAYRNWFSRLDEEVPEDLWDDIADELDIDEVWKGLETKLDKKRSPLWVAAFKQWAPRAAAVFLLLISGVAAFWFLSLPENTRPSLSKEAESTDKPIVQDKRDASLPNTGSVTLPATAPATTLAGTDLANITPIPAGILQKGAPHSGIQTPSPLRLQPVLRPSQKASAGLITPNEQEANAETPGNNGIQPEDSGALLAANRKAPFIRVQQLGIVSAYSNTWMLNHETFNGLQASTLTATSFTYDSGIAINAGFLISDKHKFGAELYLSAPAGQAYQQYIEARYQRRAIELDYYKMQLYYQLPVLKGKGDVLAGAYASWLKKGREEIAGEAHAVAHRYRSLDYGLMAGYQFNIPVNNRLLLQPGIRFNYGLPNIFKGDQQVPGDFLRTHNAAAGLYLGVSYRLH